MSLEMGFLCIHVRLSDEKLIGILHIEDMTTSYGGLCC